MRRFTSTFMALATVSLAASAALAAPTEVTVRVLSKDAKFIGTSMGGVRITIKDAETGELLATGVTRGTTGDTGKIMREPWQRDVPISTEDAAKFTAVLDLDEPRLIEVAAYGPLAQRQSANRVTITEWVVPGKHITAGDGLLLVMPGMVVDVLEPRSHVKLKGPAARRVPLQANVTMMCGCPVEPGGLWDAGTMEVVAIVKRDGKKLGETRLDYAGSTSLFAADLDVKKPGVYEAIVYAYQTTTGNTGVDRTTFIVSE